MYITKIWTGKFAIRKTIFEKVGYFGTYHTLRDAVKVRDYLNENGWLNVDLDKVCEEVGVVRCKKGGHNG